MAYEMIDCSERQGKYQSVRQLWQDMQKDKLLRKTFFHSFLSGSEGEYTVIESKILLDWGWRRRFDRPLKTKECSMDRRARTLFMSILGKVLRIYSTGHRKNDFSGAHDFFDLWKIEIQLPRTGNHSGNPYTRLQTLETIEIAYSHSNLPLESRSAG